MCLLQLTRGSTWTGDSASRPYLHTQRAPTYSASRPYLHTTVMAPLPTYDCDGPLCSGKDSRLRGNDGDGGFRVGLRDRSPESQLGLQTDPLPTGGKCSAFSRQGPEGEGAGRVQRESSSSDEAYGSTSNELLPSPRPTVSCQLGSRCESASVHGAACQAHSHWTTTRAKLCMSHEV